jgi:hypothetical protein
MALFKKGTFPLETNKSDLEYFFKMVIHSPHIASNPDYKRKAENTKFSYTHNSDVVNAYAYSESETRHGTTILAGFCNAVKLLSIGLADFKESKDVNKVKELCNWIGENTIEKSGSFTYNMIEEGISHFEYNPEGIIAINAKGYNAGAIINTIGHEMGHICLSHTLRDNVSNEVSRNDERQADLFGYNIVSNTPFSEHISIASLFVEIIFAWMEGIESIATTHPHGRERVYNFVNGNIDTLKVLGITLNNIDDFLPSK